MRLFSQSHLLTALLLLVCSGFAVRADTLQTVSPQAAELPGGADADGLTALDFGRCNVQGSARADSPESSSALFDSVPAQLLRGRGQALTAARGPDELSFLFPQLALSASAAGDSSDNRCGAGAEDEGSASLSAASGYSVGLPEQASKSGSPRISSVPEPSTLALFGAGLLGAAGVAHRRLFASRRRSQ